MYLYDSDPVYFHVQFIIYGVFFLNVTMLIFKHFKWVHNYQRIMARDKISAIVTFFAFTKVLDGLQNSAIITVTLYLLYTFDKGNLIMF